MSNYRAQDPAESACKPGAHDCVSEEGGRVLPVAAAYLAAGEAEPFIADNRQTLLAVVQYGETCGVSLDDNTLRIGVGMPQLGDAQLIEVWASDLPCTSGSIGQIRFRKNKDIMFGALCFPAAETGELEQMTSEAYAELLECITAEGYPHLFRVWNYIPYINDELGTLERYKLFCMGRHHALMEHDEQFYSDLPAASALGTHTQGLIVYFLASRLAGEQKENPRQVNAYCYPPIYGPKSPSFSRAKIMRWGAEIDFYISGTASIVGHESRHIGDVYEQLRETLRNIDTLAEDASLESGGRLRSTSDLTMLKVYIRNPADYPAIRQALEASLASPVPTIYLHADICRADLLLEIEGVYSSRPLRK